MIVQFETDEGLSHSDPLEWSHIVDKGDGNVQVFYKSGLYSNLVSADYNEVLEVWQTILGMGASASSDELEEGMGEPEGASATDGNLLVTDDGAVITPEEFELLNNPACKIHRSRQFYAQKNAKKRRK
jgi:hypothetical protein